MSVVGTPELIDWSANGSRETATENRVYQVVCSSASDTPTTARTATGIPQIGDAHPVYTTTMFCVSNDAKWVKNSTNTWIFEVTVQFATLTPDQNKGDTPDDDPVEFSIRGVEVTYPMYKDKAGTVCMHSNNQSYDPPLTGLAYDEEIVVTKSQTTINPATIASYRGAVNSSSFTVIMQDGTSRTFAAYSCRMGNITYTLATRRGTNYWRVTYPIMWRDPTLSDVDSSQPWKIRVMNEGVDQLSGTALVPCLVNKQRVTRPVRLNSVGAMYADQSDTTNVSFKFYKDYVELNFGSLSLSN